MMRSTDWDLLWKRGGFNRFPNEELVRWAATLDQGSKVLEVGCGAGANLRALESFGHEVWGVDIATEAQRASESLPGLSHATVITPVSATELPFDDEEFDAVCDVQCFQHLAQQELALAYKEAARILKPGGRFFEVSLVRGKQYFPDLPFNHETGSAKWLTGGGLMPAHKGWLSRTWDERKYSYLLVEAVRE